MPVRSLARTPGLLRAPQQMRAGLIGSYLMLLLIHYL